MEKKKILNYMNKIKCFECRKLGHIAINYTLKNNFRKRAMKAKATILVSNCGANKEEQNFVAQVT